MKVLHIGKYYPPHLGGMETHLQQLAICQKRTVDVEVLVANERGRTERSVIDGTPVTRVASFGELFSSSLTWGLSREIAETDADLVHLHAPNPIAMLAFLRSGYKGKLVITHHSDIIGRRLLKCLIQPILTKCMNRADAIIVNSLTYAESSEELAPYRHKWRIIPMATDLAHLDKFSLREVAEIRARYVR